MNEQFSMGFDDGGSGATADSCGAALSRGTDFARFDCDVAAEPLDMEQLLDRCLGNAALAQRILAKFQVCFGEDLSRLVQSFACQEVEEVRGLAHRLRGAAASVAAEELARRSAQLEELVRCGRLDEVPECLEGLRQEWDRFLEFREDCGEPLQR